MTMKSIIYTALVIILLLIAGILYYVGEESFSAITLGIVFLLGFFKEQLYHFLRTKKSVM
ncbi:hypothetical protein HZA96_02015 [Candidatus Woesearchaeota archaeon]|nr:hypothetical protein [Candidatus Woesearchaeota archaeon]